jgi:hypothetical protein
MASAVALEHVMSDLPDIHDVESVSDADDVCFAELREVLERHHALDRFGVVLLHKHFELEPDEVMVEVVDTENRTLTTRPMKSDPARHTIETVWRLDRPRGDRECERQCQSDRDGDGNPWHRIAHYTV